MGVSRPIRQQTRRQSVAKLEKVDDMLEDIQGKGDGQELDSQVTVTLRVWRRAKRGEWKTESKGSQGNVQYRANEVML